MADEIYINIGSSFQQPYQGQTPTQAQSAETKQIVKQQPASSQTLYQSPSQTPTTYRVPVNAQTDVDARQPNPFTYDAQAQIDYQSPFRSPSITQVEAQQPSPYIAQSEYQSPFTYQQEGQQEIDVASPYIAQSPYIVQANVQQVGPVSVQSHTFIRSPYIYWYQIENIKYKEPVDDILFYQGPQNDGHDVFGSAQFLDASFTPVIKQGAYVQQPYTQPGAGQVSVQQPYEFQYNGFPVSYTLAVQSPSTPVIARLPIFVTQNPVQQPTPAQQSFQAQQPVIGRSSFRTPVPARQPLRQPLELQQQITVQADQDVQNQVRAPARQPSPYIAEAQQQSPYIAQQPSTYQNPVNKQVDTQNDARQPNIYQIPYQVPYIHRSPYITQTPYATSRTIGPIAKVKAIYLNSDGQNIEKIDQVYVNNSGTIEKIHQTVPAARFSKNPSNTQQ